MKAVNKLNFRAFPVHLGLVALGGLLTFATPSFATLVTYTTQGVFSATGTNTYSGINGESIAFAGGSDILNATSTPTSENLGVFAVTKGANGSLTGSGTFTLAITQPLPPPSSSGSYPPADFTGTISTSAMLASMGDLLVTFPQTSITVNGITYALTDLVNGNQLVIAASQTTTVTANVSAAAVPEPLSIGLLGGGLALLGVFRLRKSRKA